MHHGCDAVLVGRQSFMPALRSKLPVNSVGNLSSFFVDAGQVICKWGAISSDN